jgi:hypothetical protein
LASSASFLAFAAIADHHSTTPETVTEFAQIAEKNTNMNTKALELATALESELLAQFDKLESTMQRPEFASFPIDERLQIERKQAAIHGLLESADFLKYQISRL